MAALQPVFPHYYWAISRIPNNEKKHQLQVPTTQSRLTKFGMLASLATQTNYQENSGIFSPSNRFEKQNCYDQIVYIVKTVTGGGWVGWKLTVIDNYY